MKLHTLLVGIILASLIIFGSLVLTGCNSNNIYDDSSNKMSFPVEVGLRSEKDHVSFIVAPGDEFQLNLVGRLIQGYNNKSIPGQVKFTFEKIGKGIKVENYEENQTIMLEINPYEEEKVFDTLTIKAIEKGYYYIDGEAELINSDDYRRPDALNKTYHNMMGDSGVYICVVDSIDEINEFCNFGHIDFFNPESIFHKQVEYIGSIKKPTIINKISNSFLVKSSND